MRIPSRNDSVSRAFRATISGGVQSFWRERCRAVAFLEVMCCDLHRMRIPNSNDSESRACRATISVGPA